MVARDITTHSTCEMWVEKATDNVDRYQVANVASQGGRNTAILINTGYLVYMHVSSK